MKKYFQFTNHLQKRIKNIFRSKNRPTDDFLEWCRKEYPSDAVTHQLSKYYPKGNKDVSGQDKFLEQITQKIGDGERVSAQIDTELAEDLNVVGTRIRYDRGIHQLQISGMPKNKKIILKEVSIERLILDPSSNVEIEVINCAIAYLEIQGRSDEPNKLSLTVKNTYIGEFSINGPVKKLDFCGGCILKINCAVPRGKNPFRGSVWFKNVFFPTNEKKYLREDAQPYRNMSYHLRELENTQMAHLFHRLQLRTEREKDSIVNKAISVLYEWLSDFGASALKPFLWLILLWIASFVLITINDGAVLAYQETSVGNVDHYAGWKTALTEKNKIGYRCRSAYLAVQPIVNPLGIFSDKPVVIAKSKSIALMLLAQGFFSVVLITLMVFAVRRRFRLQ